MTPPQPRHRSLACEAAACLTSQPDFLFLVSDKE